jgi:ribosome maturation protein SDO1
MSSTDFQVVRLQHRDVKVEVLAKPGMVTKYRDGQCSLSDALVDDRIFSNANKGEVPPEADLAKFDARGRELLELILKTGKYSLTAQEKRDVVERRRLEVINYIHDNFVDSTTGIPHPVVRIEAALGEIKAQIDPDMDAARIVHSLVPKLQPIIRLAEKVIEGTVKVPNSKLGQVVGICYNLATVGKEEYGPENAYIAVTLSPGKYDQFIDQLGRMSGGLAVFELKGAAASKEDADVEHTKVKKKPQARGGGKRKGG